MCYGFYNHTIKFKFCSKKCDIKSVTPCWGWGGVGMVGVGGVVGVGGGHRVGRVGVGLG